MFRRKNSYKLLDLINSFQSSSLDYLTFKRQLLSGFAFFVALLIILFAFTAYSVVLKDRETARHQVESFAQAIEAHVQYSIESVDLSLISFSNAMKTLPVRQGSDAAIIEQLLARSQDTNGNFWLLFIDARGDAVAASNELDLQGVSFADQDYFRIHLASQTGLYVSEPALDKITGRAQFVISRRVEAADGRFMGVIAAPINARRFAYMFANARFAPDVSIALAHKDGKIIAQSSNIDDPFFSDDSDVNFLLTRKTNFSGTTELIGPVDRKPRIYGYRTLNELPLVVIVGNTNPLITAPAEQGLLIGGIALALIILVTSISVRFIISSYADVKRNETRYKQLYSSIRDGIILLDAQGHILKCNDAFLEITGYARDDLLGTDFSGHLPQNWRSPDFLSSLYAERPHSVTHEMEGHYARKDGRSISIDMKCWLLCEEKGAAPMIGAIVRDTTQQKQIQHMLLESHTVLERAVKARTAELTMANGMLENSQAALRNLAAHQNRIREEERSRIAREVHDELGGHLTGIKAYISTAVEELNNHGSGSTKLLNQASIMVDESVKTVRKIITELRPSVLDQLGIWSALEWYADQFGQQTSIQCNCVLDAVAGIHIAQEGSTMIFRIVQESLTNIARHAHASEVTIRGACMDKQLLIEIEDDGVGFQMDQLVEQKSWGIIGMRERAYHFGAELLIAAKPNSGTTISLHIPLSHENKYRH